MKAAETHPWAKGRLLYLVRHGQYDTSGGPQNGHLTDLGKRQARLLAKQLKAIPFSKVWSSDVVRAVETTEIVTKVLGLSTFPKRKLFREVLPRAEGDSSDAERRVKAIAAELEKGGKTTRQELVICHGNLIRLLLCKWLEIPEALFPRMLVHNTGITRVMVTAGTVRVAGFNDVSHLPLKLQTLM